MMIGSKLFATIAKSHPKSAIALDRHLSCLWKKLIQKSAAKKKWEKNT